MKEEYKMKKQSIITRFLNIINECRGGFPPSEEDEYKNAHCANCFMILERCECKGQSL